MAATCKGRASSLPDSKGGSSSGSDSSSTAEEERLRRLFVSCDHDKDGFIDSEDLLLMCRRLNMEDAVEELRQQLGMGTHGMISFEQFIRCRRKLIEEIEQVKSCQMEELQGNTRQLMSWPNSSDNSLANSGIGYDSGAQDLGTEPPSLHKLFEASEPELYQKFADNPNTNNCLEMANSLHLAAIASMKADIRDLSNRLQHVTTERDLLEKQLSKSQSEKFNVQREWQERMDELSLRYEERITELHSVIAELRRKIERTQINVIREEEEYEESETNSVNGNNPNDSQCASMELGQDLNAELNRVVTELENRIEGRQDVTVADPSQPYIKIQPYLKEGSLEQTAHEVCEQVENRLQPESDSSGTEQMLNSKEQMMTLRIENKELREKSEENSCLIQKLREQIQGLSEERDLMKRANKELQMKSFESPSSPSHPWLQSPTKSPLVTTGTLDRPLVSSEPSQIAKVAELKRLKPKPPSGAERITGVEITSKGLPSSKVAEHLAANLKESCNMQELVQGCSAENVSDEKLHEFEIEVERLTSKIDNLKSQNDLLSITLEESKSHADRLSVLMGKYESNNMALQLAVNYADQLVEVYDVFVALLESEAGVMLVNCRAAGLGTMAGVNSEAEEQEDISALLQRTHTTRKMSENMAKQLIQRLDRNSGIHGHAGYQVAPWEDLSSTSRTTSTTSSTGSSGDTEFSKMDEQKVREYIQQLKNDRSAVQMTVMELESIHIDPLSADAVRNPEAQRLDLENAVLMQELMAMKEEKAELKAHAYLLEREKKSIELRLNGKESQEQAYIVQIEHLKGEMKEYQRRLQREERIRRGEKNPDSDSSSDKNSSAGNSQTDRRTHSPSEVVQDLQEALRRERKLKARVHELMTTLEKLSRNSEVRHQQSAEFVNDLKKANSALISAFERAKKKYQSKMKKMEAQLQNLREQYETQIKLLRQRIGQMEQSSNRGQTNETSL